MKEKLVNSDERIFMLHVSTVKKAYILNIKCETINVTQTLTLQINFLNIYLIFFDFLKSKNYNRLLKQPIHTFAKTLYLFTVDLIFVSNQNDFCAHFFLISTFIRLRKWLLMVYMSFFKSN